MPGSQEGQEEGPLNHPRDIIDSHTGVIFKKQEILKFSDIYLYQIGKFMYLFKRGLPPNYFVMFLLLQTTYILIIQEIPVFSIHLIVEVNFENSQFGCKILSFSTR